MKYILLMLVVAAGCISATAASFDNTFLDLLTFGDATVDPTGDTQQDIANAAHIKDAQFVGAGFGIAFTAQAIYATEDGGLSWFEMDTDKALLSVIAGAKFRDRENGVAAVYDRSNSEFYLNRTRDGGITWTRTAIALTREDRAEGDLENVQISFAHNGSLVLEVRLPTSSNFVGRSIYRSLDLGRNWRRQQREISIAGETKVRAVKKDWTLLAVGGCEKKKLDCVLESKILDKNGVDITPAQVKYLAEIKKTMTEGELSSTSFGLNSFTRISTSRGFDKCTAATVAQMKIWWYQSPFRDANIYISGRNRGCSQPQLTAAWVTRVAAMGWGLIPTVVGYQSACSTCTTCQKHSSDPATAETQGRGEADIAVTDATTLGIPAGVPLYYDMERYDDTSGTGACSIPTKAFLKGWTDRLHELGYISGTYGSPTNANNDWINIAPESQMDAVWLARWNSKASVWSVPPLPSTYWVDNQRIHQWLGPRNETWGGVTFNIDNNILSAPVAGATYIKNGLPQRSSRLSSAKMGSKSQIAPIN